MKKLIVAAAIAVVAGGAFALDGYDFTATLKTTKGKASGAQIATYPLGVDEFGTFWFDDTSITSLVVNVNGVPVTNDIQAAGYAFAYLQAATNTDTKTIKGKAGIKSLKLVDKKGNVLPTGAGYLANPTEEQKALVIQLAAKYNKKSEGQYCEQVKIENSGCYRVAGSAKINISLFTTNCCEWGGGSWFTNMLTGVNTKYYNYIPNYYVTYAAWGDYAGTGIPFTNASVAVGLDMWFIQRFGAITSEKANKVELGADVIVPTADAGRWFSGSLAGQGTWSNGRVASVSGNIVGEMDPALCTYCCDYPDVALAFACDDPTAWDNLTTAAFGTFRLKYNSKLK